MTGAHSNFSDRTFYVVGAGAIGRVVTALLCKAGKEPTLLCREQTANKIRENGGYDFITNGDETTLASPHVLSYSDLEHHQLPDNAVIFYATKASYLSSTMQKMNPLLSQKDNIKHVFLQGGIPWWFGHNIVEGSLENITDPNNQIKNAVGSLSNVYAGMIKFGAFLDKNAMPEKSHLKGQGDFAFGSIHTNSKQVAFCHELADLFDPNLVKPYVVDTPLFETIWQKAAGSFSMSAMAMSTGKTLGDMYNDPEIRSKMIDMARTIVEIGYNIGVRSETKTDFDTYFKNIAERKPQHMMSITADSSEITQIIEWPMQIGKRIGVDVSRLESIYAQIPQNYKNILDTPVVQQEIRPSTHVEVR